MDASCLSPGSRSRLERRTIEGESPVYESDMVMKWILSSVRWISRVNVGGRDFQS